jgi:hypothetical protein
MISVLFNNNNNIFLTFERYCLVKIIVCIYDIIWSVRLSVRPSACVHLSRRGVGVQKSLIRQIVRLGPAQVMEHLRPKYLDPLPPIGQKLKMTKK